MKTASPQLEALRAQLKTSIGRTVGITRTRQNRSQKDLLEELGKYGLVRTQGSVSQIETGKRLPSLEALFVLARYLDISADYLLGLTNNALSAKDKDEALAATKGEAKINRVMAGMSKDKQQQILQFAEYLSRQGSVDVGSDSKSEELNQLKARAVDLLDSVEEMFGVDMRKELDKEFRDRNIPVGNNTT